ncbi:MAG TPA: hydrolase [Synergistaceae bacterium]|jgi:nicotinamidase-related amidase|nr:hydrolase [Synergistaceae bacterium]
MTFRLRRNEVRLLMIDVQERLLPVITGRETIVKNAVKLAKAADVLTVPFFYTEQYPKGIGGTDGRITGALPETARRLEKVHFSCCSEEAFDGFLFQEPRPVTVLFGIESHICVLGTVLDMIAQGHKIAVAADACGSRSPENHALAMEAMRAAGALVVPTETVVYHMIGRSGTPEFKALLPLFKE